MPRWNMYDKNAPKKRMVTNPVTGRKDVAWEVPTDMTDWGKKIDRIPPLYDFYMKHSAMDNRYAIPGITPYTQRIPGSSFGETISDDPKAFTRIVRIPPEPTSTPIDLSTKIKQAKTNTSRYRYSPSNEFTIPGITESEPYDDKVFWEAHDRDMARLKEKVRTFRESHGLPPLDSYGPSSATEAANVTPSTPRTPVTPGKLKPSRPGKTEPSPPLPNKMPSDYLPEAAGTNPGPPGPMKPKPNLPFVPPGQITPVAPRPKPPSTSDAPPDPAGPWPLRRRKLSPDAITPGMALARKRGLTNDTFVENYRGTTGGEKYSQELLRRDGGGSTMEGITEYLGRPSKLQSRVGLLGTLGQAAVAGYMGYHLTRDAWDAYQDWKNKSNK